MAEKSQKPKIPRRRWGLRLLLAALAAFMIAGIMAAIGPIEDYELGVLHVVIFSAFIFVPIGIFFIPNLSPEARFARKHKVEVYKKSKEPLTNMVVICQGCGAKIVVLQNTVAICKFCDSPVS